MKIQNFTYHTHNSELNFDGRNTAEEMITRAEELGFETIGVSNHLIYNPYVAPPSDKMFYCDLDKAIDDYKRNIEILREIANYHKIKVKVGFETDFFPSTTWRKAFEKIRKLPDIDYFLGSTHFIRSDDEKFMCNLYHMYKSPEIKDNPEYNHWLANYWNNIVMAIESGYFDFIAHIDYCVIKDLCTTPEWNEYRWKVIEALATYKQPYELNTSGFNRVGIQHPTTWMIEELNKRDVPIVISDDAHCVEHIGQHFERAENLLAKIGYKKRFKLPD